MRAAAARADDLALLERGVGHRRPPSDRPSRPHATSWAGFSPRAHHTPRPDTSRRVAASPPLTLLLPTPKRVPTTSPLASSAPRPCPRRVPRVDLGSFNDCHHCHHMPRVVLRGTSTATAPKPRLLDSCAAAVYASAATPSRDPRRPVCRALLPSLPALLDRMLTICMLPRRPPRGPRPSSRPRRGCPPRVHSARSSSRAVVGSQGSITSPSHLSLLATLSSALAACRASRRGTGRSAARLAAKAKTKN